MILDIPYHSQEDFDAKRFGNDCGAACAAMILEWGGKGRQSVNDLAALTPLTVKDDGLMPTVVARLLTTHGMPAEYRYSQTADMILADIEKRQKPVIALIRYGDIAERQNKGDVEGGHYVLVVGSDEQNVYLNDPDFWGAQLSKGKGLAVSRQEFKNAVAKAHVSAPGYAIFLKDPPDPAATTTTTTTTITKTVVTEAKTVSAGTTGGTASTTTTSTSASGAPLTHTIPPGPAHVNVDGLNMRKTAAGAFVKTLGHSANVTIQADTPAKATLNGKEYVWVHITSGTDDGWCVESSLAAGNA